MAGGDSFSLALKTNGAVLAWGAELIATHVPISATSGVTQIAAGEWHALALKNGGVMAWGSNGYGQCDVPVDLTSGVSAISGGGYYSMALKNGGVQVFGIPATHVLAYSIREVPAAATSGVSAISAGRWHALALKDGGVIAWGSPFYDATNVPVEATSGVSAIAAGDLFSMALKTNGTLVIWGDATKGQSPIPIFASTGLTQIAAGSGHCLVISPVMPPRFTGYNLPDAYSNQVYSGSVTAVGDPAVHYYPFGTLPGWMTLDGDSGAIGGTPMMLGTTYFGVIASNSVGMVTNSYTVFVQILPEGPPVFVTTNPLPDGVVGAPYSVQIVASNNPSFWLDGAGNALPLGLTLSTNGLISGTPTETYDKFITVIATNLAGSSNRFYNITINPPAAPPEFITTNPLPSGVVGQPYSLQLVVSNYPSSFSLFSGSLPVGLDLTASGMVTGTPVQIENPAFTVRATNLVGASNRVYTLEIFGPPVISTTNPLPSGVVGASYSQQIMASGNPLFSVMAGSLPDGLTLNEAGWVNGIPNEVGPFNFTVLATNAYGWTNRVYDLTVEQIPVFSTTNPLPSGKVGEAYSKQIEATGSPTFSVVAGSLPGGLNLNATGLLNGSPSVAGPFNFTVRATNTFGWSNRVFDISIANFVAPEITLIRVTNSHVRLEWTNSNAGGFVQVWRATNIIESTVLWSNLGVQSSPWTNTTPLLPSYYQLRMTP